MSGVFLLRTLSLCCSSLLAICINELSLLLWVGLFSRAALGTPAKHRFVATRIAKSLEER